MKILKHNKPITSYMPLEMSPEEFRETAHRLVDQIAGFLDELPLKPVTTGEQPEEIRRFLGNKTLPRDSSPATTIINEATQLLFEHSLFNGHPNFWGYITSSAAPIGALGDLLAAVINPNVGAFALSPMATEIEKQTIAWLAELIGFPVDCGGVFVSGGNMANFTGFLAARKAKASWNIRKEGLNQQNHSHKNIPWGYFNPRITKTSYPKKQLTLYCSSATHTWVQKAADLFGLGTDAIRWIAVNANQQMDVNKLSRQIMLDITQGYTPFMVVGTAGSVSSGSVDPLAAIAKVCRQFDLWFHVDGAYGVPAVALPETAEMFEGLKEADSIALDPHKWLYSPLEAGCILVRNKHHLQDAFSFNPDYYNFDGNLADVPTDYHDHGMQNSRGFRALKVWMGIKQAGKNGYINMIRQDIKLAQQLFHLANEEPDLQAVSHNLSITTFRYVPTDLPENAAVENYLNLLNEKLLNRLQTGGEVFLSNAIMGGKYCLRVCIVNFRTTYDDIKALIEVVLREGKIVDEKIRLNPILRQQPVGSI